MKIFALSVLLLFPLCTYTFAQPNVKLYQGVNFISPPVYVSAGSSYLNIWAGYTVKNYGTSSVLIDQFTVAILNGGVEQFDLPSALNITIAAGQTYTFPTANGYVTSTGSFTAVARYKFSGVWYDIPTWESGTVNPFAFTVLPTPSPSLVSPSDYSVYNSSSTSSISFQWTSVNNATAYWLNVFPSGSSSTPVFNASVGNQTSYPLNPSSWSNNVYIWQVKAYVNGVWGSYSNPARQFIADTPPNVPTISGPANGSSFSLTSSTTFSWSGPSGVTIARYNLLIVPGSNLNGTPVYNPELTGTSQGVTFNSPPYNTGSYIWSVRAIKVTPPGYNQSTYESAIGWGQYAPTQTLSLTPLPPTSPVLISPADYGIFNQKVTSSITFQWTSVSNAIEYWLNVFPSGNSSNPVFNGTVGNVTSYPLSMSVLSTGEYIWQVKVRTSGGWSAYSTARRYIADTPPGAPSITAPANGLSFTIGNSTTFSWSGPSGVTIARYNLLIVPGSNLNGTPVYNPELTGTSQGVTFNSPLYNTGSYIWSVRAIKVTPSGYDQPTYESTIGWGQYASTQTFSLTPPPPQVNILSPNGNENWTAGTSHIITWSSTSVSNVKIDYTTDNGVSWIIVVSSAPAGSGSYSWIVRNTPSQLCKVRISDVTNSGINSISANTFTISLPTTITVHYPTDGVELPIGKVQTILWTAVNVSSVNIDLSIDNGTSWSSIASNIPASPGSYSWTVPESLSSNCQMRISDYSNPSTSGLSTGTFILAYILTRQLSDGTYEQFNVSRDGWEFGNGDLSNGQRIMWPQSWWSTQFVYSSSPYPIAWQYWPINAKSSDFPDWPSFVQVFGEDKCYINPPPNFIVYNPIAVLRWSVNKGSWGGSCFGFAISSFLAFDNQDAFLSRYPEIGNFDRLYDVDFSNNARSVINELWTYQLSSNEISYQKQNMNRTPAQTLNDIRQMILNNNRNDQALSFWNQSGPGVPGGHTVNPYKIERDAINSSLEYVYIYDNNHPNDSTKRIEIRTDLNAWLYNDLEWGGNMSFFLEQPVSNYLTNPSLDKNVFSKDLVTSTKTVQNGYFQFYNSDNASILISDSSKGHIIGYGDSLAFNTFADGIPIIPTTGGFHPPIGYYLPMGSYTITMSSFGDSLVSFSIISDSMSYSYSRSDANQSQIDNISYRNGLAVGNHDSQTKKINLKAISIDHNRGRVFNIENTLLTQHDSLQTQMGQSGDLRVVNYGNNNTYDLNLDMVSPNGDTIFGHKNISIPSNSAHQILPNWDSLGTQSVKILIDNGNTGSTNDSMLVANQIINYPVMGKWNMVSLPLIVDDARKNILYPTAASNTFAYSSNGYLIQDTLKNGVGYWVKFNALQDVSIWGNSLLLDTINVVAGWNLIGSLALPIPTATINSIPPGIVTSNFFGYHEQYFTTDTIYPSRGYWVKVNQSGALLLSTGSNASLLKNASTARIHIVPTSELPPAPPNEDATTIDIPKIFALEQNYPNPFNPATTLRYALPTDSKVTLKIYNVLGQVVSTLVNGIVGAGYQSAQWNASNAASGVYFYRIEATSVAKPSKAFVQVRKMVLVK